MTRGKICICRRGIRSIYIDIHIFSYDLILRARQMNQRGYIQINAPPLSTSYSNEVLSLGFGEDLGTSHPAENNPMSRYTGDNMGLWAVSAASA